MKKFRIASLLMTFVLALSLFASSAFAEEPEDLMDALAGSYDELFTVICAPEYDEIWMERCIEYAGAENAQAAFDMLHASCTGTIYGQDAVDAYADDPASAVFDCYFTGGVAQFHFDGHRISGTDAEGNEVFSHEYSYVETLPGVIACHVYRTEDADAGEFTYFLLSDDSPASTYHLEFRYGDDLDALAKYDSGKYAYWLAAGIPAERDEQLIWNVIDLFCAENLAEMAA